MIRRSIARIPSKAERADRPVVQAAVAAFDKTYVDPDIALHGKYVCACVLRSATSWSFLRLMLGGGSFAKERAMVCWRGRAHQCRLHDGFLARVLCAQRPTPCRS